jgi:hypothetical protein
MTYEYHESVSKRILNIFRNSVIHEKFIPRTYDSAQGNSIGFWKQTETE